MIYLLPDYPLFHWIASTITLVVIHAPWIVLPTQMTSTHRPDLLQEAFYLLREIRCLAVHAPASTIECDQLPRAHGSDLLEGIPSDGLMTDKQCFDAFTVLESRFVEMVRLVSILDNPLYIESRVSLTLFRNHVSFESYHWLWTSGAVDQVLSSTHLDICMHLMNVIAWPEKCNGAINKHNNIVTSYAVSLI